MYIYIKLSSGQVAVKGPRVKQVCLLKARFYLWAVCLDLSTLHILCMLDAHCIACCVHTHEFHTHP